MQSKFTRWIREGWNDGSAGFELKLGKGHSVPFSNIPEHQVKALMDAGTGGDGMVHKISDSAIGYLPFDCFVLRDAGAWFVFGFYGGSEVWMVDVKDVFNLMYGVNGERRRGSVGVGWCREVGRRVW